VARASINQLKRAALRTVAGGKFSSGAPMMSRSAVRETLWESRQDRGAGDLAMRDVDVLVTASS
jgi:hypothetical protein